MAQEEAGGVSDDHAAHAEHRRIVDRLGRGVPLATTATTRVGRALRQLSSWMLPERAESELEQAADVLEALARALGADGDPPPTRYTGALHDGTEFLANARGTHPLLGSAHPLAAPIELHAAADHVIGDVTFDTRFEGNTGWVHGGFIAAGFDIVLVQAARFGGHAGPTGTLEVRFRAPTPIGVALRYEGRFSRLEGRKSFVEGRLVRVADGQVTADARAIVIAPAA